MQSNKILVVDDEDFNLEIISEFLEGPEFDLTLFASADEAWAHLRESGDVYRVILLDRMMPGMNGIELLRLLKSDDRFRRVPVIMQTAAASSAEVGEGIAAGAYYYLAKPYSAVELLAIVRAALAEQGLLETEIAALSPVQQVGKEYEFRSFIEARTIALQLASQCPHPEITAIGLTELLINAVEHGNLALTYAEKKRLRLLNEWEGEIERRLASPEYADRFARVSLTRTEDEVTFTITDCGDGFDWERYLEIDPARAYDPNGRGIAMARQLSFSSLRYEGCGNVAVAVVSLREREQ